jgi:20S proteasome alpha/beta subunit
MTIIIALKCKNGNIIASDGRIVIFDEFRSDQKIYKISKNVLIGLTGSQGVIKRIVRALSGINVSSLDNDEEIKKIENTLAEIYRYHREIYGSNYTSRDDFDRQFYGNLLAIDNKNIYKFFFDGYPEPCGKYEAIGSASGYVRTLIEGFYDESMDIEKGLELAVYCILQAMKVSRDIGEPIQLGVVEEDEEKEAKILGRQIIDGIVKRINGREKILHDIWNIMSREPEFQEEIEKLIKSKLSQSTQDKA